ncbi:MAG: hypothetical protein AB7Q00_05695 [Phycisphaerales bacterium]
MHARLPLRMNLHVLLVSTLVCATLVFLPSCGEKDYNAREARQAFEAWTVAVGSRNADAVVEFHQKATYDRYTRLISIALAFGKRNEIRAMPNADKYEVLFIRAYVPRKELLRMDGQAYVRYMSESGFSLFTQSISGTISRIRATDDFADITLKPARKGDTAPTYRFVREGDRWLIDDRERLATIERAFVNAPQTNSTESDRAFATMFASQAGISDRDLTDVWDRCIR